MSELELAAYENGSRKWPQEVSKSLKVFMATYGNVHLPECNDTGMGVKTGFIRGTVQLRYKRTMHMCIIRVCFSVYAYMYVNMHTYMHTYMLWFNFIFGLIFFQTSSFFSNQFHFFKPVPFF